MVPLGVNLKQNIQFHYLASSTGLQFECVLPLNRVRNEGFQHHRPDPTKLRLPPPPPTPQEKFLPLCIAIIQQNRHCRFFSELNKKQGMEQRGLNSDLP